MSTALGVTGQLGIGRESTFGTAVTPTNWLPFTGEGIDPGLDYIRSEALRSDTGRGRLASARIAGKQAATAQTTLEINNKGFGLPLRAIFGSVTTTQPNVGTDPTVYDHTFVPATAMGAEIYTIETGFIDDASSAYSKKATSAMVDKASFEIGGVDSLASCAIDWLAQGAAVANSRTSASYTAGLVPLGGGAATCTLGGVTADSVSCKIAVNQNLDGDRYYLGGAGARKQPVAGRLEVTAELDGDFKDWTAFNRVLNNTYASLVLTLPGAIISNAYHYQLQLTLNVATVGDAPKLTGPGRIDQPLKFEAYDDGTGPGSIITAVYRTTQATPV